MTRPIKRLSALAATLVAVCVLISTPGAAQVPLPIPTLEPSPSPSPTATRSTKPKPKPTATSTSRPREPDAEPTRTRNRETQTDSARRSAPAVDPIVRRGLSIWEEREKTPARTTTRLLDLLEEASPGDAPLTLEQKAAGFGRFPVVGYVWYQDDWAAPRYIPYFHLHEGTDLFARSGTPVIACVNGVIWKTADGGSGGNAIWLLGDDDVRYYYGHLKTITDGVKAGTRVAVGDVIGTVGATGNAKGTYPHVHFEINPGGRGTINPKPVIDGWLRAAERRLLDELVFPPGGPGRLGAARWGMLTQMLAEPAGLQSAMWTSAFDLSSTLAFADLALTELLAMHDWPALDAPRGATGNVGTFPDLAQDPFTTLHHAADDHSQLHASE